MQLAQWQASGTSFDYRGHRVFYRREGHGDPLLLVHGFPTASWDWYRMWPDLITRFDVIAPDLIGFGFSDKPPKYDYTLKDQATLTENLLHELGVDRAHCLCHDYGVSVLQEMLARQAERDALSKHGLRLRSVCFLNGGLFPGVHRPLLIQKLLMSPVGPLLTPFIGRSSLVRSFRRIFGAATQPTEAELNDFWTLIEHNDGKRVIHRLLQYMYERVEHGDRWVGALTSTDVPLRMVNGLTDPLSGSHLAEHYQRTVPDADVVGLDGIGHYPQVEDPDGVLQPLLEFIARVEG